MDAIHREREEKLDSLFPGAGNHGVMKQPDIIHREGFLVMGTLTTIKPGTERPETFASIWKDFETHREGIERQSTDPRYFGISFSSAQEGSIDYIACMAVGPVETVPEGLVLREIPAATYAVFACPVHAIGQTYGYIFGQWLSTSGCELDASKPAFEQYPAAADTSAPVRIHIPIREK